MILKIGGVQVATAEPIITQKEGILWPLVEKGRDAGTEMTSDAAIWILEKLADVAHDIGIFLLQAAPDLFLTMGMLCTLGSIASIPKAGKWASGSVAASIVFEIVRGSVMGL